MYLQTIFCHSYTYVIIFIIRFLNSSKLCIALGSGTQTKIRGAHLLWGVQCWVAQTDSGIWSSRKLKSFSHTLYWDAANNKRARSRIYCPGQMMAVNHRHRFELPWLSAFSNRKILPESTDKCWTVRTRFCLFLNIWDPHNCIAEESSLPDGMLRHLANSYRRCILTTLNGGEWLALRPVRFIPEEKYPGIHTTRGCVGPAACLNAWRREILK
jgi:hypothetical protein